MISLALSLITLHFLIADGISIWPSSVNLPALTPSKADLIDFPFNTSLHALLNCFNFLVASPGYPSCINSIAMFKWLAILSACSSSILSNLSDSLSSAFSPTFLVIVEPSFNKGLRPLAIASVTLLYPEP